MLFQMDRRDIVSYHVVSATLHTTKLLVRLRGNWNPRDTPFHNRERVTMDSAQAPNPASSISVESTPSQSSLVSLASARDLIIPFKDGKTLLAGKVFILHAPIFTT